MSSKFGFILVKPQLGENIGACARSMKNFGFTNLNIVSPKFAFPNHKTKVTAVGAYNIIDKAKIFNTTDKAISKFDIVISLSARRRDINKKHITMKDFSNILRKRRNANIDHQFSFPLSKRKHMYALCTLFRMFGYKYQHMHHHNHYQRDDNQLKI